MPVHDWTRVQPGIFHHFHHDWISETSRAVNRSLHGTDYYALAEQVAGSFGPDVLTLKRPLKGPTAARKPVAAVRPSVLLRKKPKMRFHIKDEKKWYAATKKAVTIRHVS